MSLFNVNQPEVMEADDEPDSANPHAYTGSYAMICTEAADVEKTLSDMCCGCGRRTVLIGMNEAVLGWMERSRL